jgi:hypothetical protein
MPHAPILERFAGSGNSSLQIAITRMPYAIQHVCRLTRSHGTRACGACLPTSKPGPGRDIAEMEKWSRENLALRVNLLPDSHPQL